MTALPARVLWLDPGLSTGWAMLLGEDFTSGQLKGLTEAGDMINDVLNAHGFMCIGWEAYLIAKGGRITGNPEPSLEVIGMARWLAHHHGATVLPSVPSSFRTVATRDAVHGMEWFPRGDHAFAATQHLLAWCLRSGHLKEQTDAVYRRLLA